MDLRSHLQSTLGDTYTFEQELAGGGMSRVFVAEETALARKVVVKVLPMEMAGQVSIDRFRREIRLAASLQQANIVPVLSAGDAGGVAYFTMPFVRGESLRARLDSQGVLPIAECVAILRDVTRALAHAHEAGVVHRDIKPENILLSGDTAVVTDFGIAKAVMASRTPGDAATLTQLGVAIGTPMYMAPEQAFGEAIDQRTDLYALGVVAYELLCGSPPFERKTAQALIAAHATEIPLAVDERRRDAPAGFAALVMRCLEKDPDRRPQNAREVLAALETSLTASPGVAGSVLSAKPSIAVLPFANLSPDPSDEYFADGLTDEVITDLSTIRSLRVIARASMMRFRGSSKDPVAVAGELNVRYVLDGSVRRAGSSLRLTARLIDASDGSTLWADKLGGTLDDVFAMQEQLSRTIVRALEVTLSPQEERRLAERPIEDVRAWECYLQARQAMWTFTLPSFDRAKQLLENALEIVGENPRLLSTLGVVHALYVETGQADAESHIAAAMQCARRVERIDPDATGLHWLRSAIHRGRGELRESIALLERVHAREPNNGDVLSTLSYACFLSGQDERGRTAAEAAIAVDPLTPMLRCMPGFYELLQGRPAAGVPYYRKFLAMEPTNPAAHFFLLTMLAHAGENAEAMEIGERLARDYAGTIFGPVGFAYAKAASGDAVAARAAIGPELRAAAQQSEMFGRFLAELLAMSDESEAAIDALEAAVRFGLAHYPYLSRHDRLLDPLRGHARFQRLLETVHERWKRGGTAATDLV